MILGCHSRRVKQGPGLGARDFRQNCATFTWLGCLSFRRAFASICRIRSRVTSKSCPFLQRMIGGFADTKSLAQDLLFPRVSVSNAPLIWRCKSYRMAASNGETAFLSSIKSPRWLSSSRRSEFRGKSAHGRFSESSAPYPAANHPLGDLFRRRFTSKLLHQMPRGPISLLIVSIICTGIRMVRCLVGNRASNRLPNPPGRIGTELVARLYSNLSTAFIKPILPS